MLDEKKVKFLLEKLKRKLYFKQLSLIQRHVFARIDKELIKNTSHIDLSSINFADKDVKFLEYVLINLDQYSNICLIKWHSKCVSFDDDDLKRKKLMEDIKEKLNENMQKYEESPEIFYLHFDFSFS